MGGTAYINSLPIMPYFRQKRGNRPRREVADFLTVSFLDESECVIISACIGCRLNDCLSIDDSVFLSHFHVDRIALCASNHKGDFAACCFHNDSASCGYFSLSLPVVSDGSGFVVFCHGLSAHVSMLGACPIKGIGQRKLYRLTALCFKWMRLKRPPAASPRLRASERPAFSGSRTAHQRGERLRTNRATTAAGAAGVFDDDRPVLYIPDHRLTTTPMKVRQRHNVPSLLCSLQPQKPRQKRPKNRTLYHERSRKVRLLGHIQNCPLCVCP